MSSSAPSAGPKLHWMPIEPSWVISILFIIMAVLPHKVPASARWFLQGWIGSVCWLGVVCWVSGVKPVLGVAMLVFWMGVIADGWREGKGLPEMFVGGQRVERFIGPPTIRKDRVTPGQDQGQGQGQGQRQQRHRWLEEEILMEEPEGIQELAEGPGLLLDRVSGKGEGQGQGSNWLGEESLNEHPTAIQDRPVWSMAESDDRPF